MGALQCMYEDRLDGDTDDPSGGVHRGESLYAGCRGRALTDMHIFFFCISIDFVFWYRLYYQ